MVTWSHLQASPHLSGTMIKHHVTGLKNRINMANANTYPFPLLDINDLVQQFKTAMTELNLNSNDFTKPKSERWQEIYTILLEDLTDNTPDQLLQPSLDLLSKFQYPDLYEEALPLFLLATVMRRLIYAAGIDDFNVRDITDPKPKRLQRNMSAILNFLYFRTERQTVFESFKAQQADQLKMRDSLMKENMDIKAEINRIRSERAEREPEVNELAEKNEELQKFITSMNESASNKKKLASDTSQRMAEKKARLADLKARVAAAKEEGGYLSKRIVQSPDRMKENIHRLGKQVEQLRVVKEERSARRVELLKMKENLETIQDFCDQALDLTNKINADIAEQKEKQREVQALRDKVVEKREELNDLETREKQLERIIVSKQEKFSKLCLAQANKKKSQMNTLQRLREEREALNARQTEDAAEKDSFLSAIRDVRQADMLDEAHHNNVIEQLQNKYEALLEQLDVYHSRLTEAWNQVEQQFN